MIIVSYIVVHFMLNWFTILCRYICMTKIYFLLSFTKNAFHELKIRLGIILILSLNETTIKKKLVVVGFFLGEVSLSMPIWSFPLALDITWCVRYHHEPLIFMIVDSYLDKVKLLKNKIFEMKIIKCLRDNLGKYDLISRLFFRKSANMNILDEFYYAKIVIQILVNILEDSQTY